jgi:hypothetical protein
VTSTRRRSRRSSPTRAEGGQQQHVDLGQGRTRTDVKPSVSSGREMYEATRKKRKGRLTPPAPPADMAPNPPHHPNSMEEPMPKLRTETIGTGDMSWLDSTHGIANARTVTIDISTFTAGTHFPNGYIPSGTPVALARPASSARTRSLKAPRPASASSPATC